jgi:hypothetical protein
VADHYEAQVRLPESGSADLAALAPPLRRSIFSGTLAITLYWLAVLSPGFVDAKRAVLTALTFAGAGTLALGFWLRSRKRDKVRLDQYRKGRICLDCGHRFDGHK